MNLRPDVQKTVSDLIANTPQPARYSDYHFAKIVLSQKCGFDCAKKEDYDQRQYDAALSIYCKAVGF